MTRAHALTLATQALQREAKRLAFESNLYKRGLRTTETERAHRERAKIVEAIEVIREMN